MERLIVTVVFLRLQTHRSQRRRPQRWYKKGGWANTVKLSPESEVQVARLVLTVATDVQKMHKRRSAMENMISREKLQAGFRQGHLPVQLQACHEIGPLQGPRGSKSYRCRPHCQCRRNQQV